MRLIHSADWQIGMQAGSAGAGAQRVRAERLEAARRVVEAGREHNAQMLLLTGDVFENNAVDRLLVRRIGEILRDFPGPVFIIPGNHDPLTPGSVWGHSVWSEAGNITIFEKSEPARFDEITLFPCPLHEKYSTADPTTWIDDAAREHGGLKVGLAHGTVEGLPGDDPDYPIRRDRATRAGLDYLALGHWHSFTRYDEPGGACRMAYSGAHEQTKFDERDSGNVVLIELPGAGEPPVLTPIRTGGLTWTTLAREIHDTGMLEELRGELDALENPANALVRVRLTGLLFPEDRDHLERLREICETRFLAGVCEADELLLQPADDQWLEALPAGYLQEAARQLRDMARDEGDPQKRLQATHALLQLFELQEKAAKEK